MLIIFTCKGILEHGDYFIYGEFVFDVFVSGVEQSRNGLPHQSVEATALELQGLQQSGVVWYIHPKNILE